MQELIELTKLFGLDRAGMILMIGVLFKRLLQEIDRKEAILREILPLTSKGTRILIQQMVKSMSPALLPSM